VIFSVKTSLELGVIFATVNILKSQKSKKNEGHGC
jgi:hypothetical protein